jgi:NAD(P)-dependent dehydrogenase (short-subunit alcohol dehydrogenase family)
MDLSAASVLVTGGASGLGWASAQRLAERGAHVVVADLPSSAGAERAAELGDLGAKATFAPADVTDADAVAAAVRVAAGLAPLRAVVHCAGRGGTVRVLQKDGSPGEVELFETVLRVNVVGTYNVLRFAASAMAANDEHDGDRGVFVLTASIAAWEGQIGQLPYAASKAAIVGMTLNAARDLAQRSIRVCTIAPGVFDTPILSRFSDEIKAGLAAGIPHPKRLGRAAEFAQLAAAIIDNPMLNGETIRLDGAQRMAPR